MNVYAGNAWVILTGVGRGLQIRGGLNTEWFDSTSCASAIRGLIATVTWFNAKHVPWERQAKHVLVYGVVLCERAVDTADGTEVLIAGSIMSGAMPQAGNGAGRTCRCAKYADSSTVSHKAQIALVEPFVLLQSLLTGLLFIIDHSFVQKPL